MSKKDSRMIPEGGKMPDGLTFAKLSTRVTRGGIASDAAIPEHIEKLRAKLDSAPGFDLNSRTESGRPPLYYALMNSNYEAANLLMRSGARCDALTSPELQQIRGRISEDLAKAVSESSASLSQEASQALTKQHNTLFATMSVAMGSVLKAMNKKGVLEEEPATPHTPSTPSTPRSIASSVSVSSSSRGSPL